MRRASTNYLFIEQCYIPRKCYVFVSEEWGRRGGEKSRKSETFQCLINLLLMKKLVKKLEKKNLTKKRCKLTVNFLIKEDIALLKILFLNTQFRALTSDGEYHSWSHADQENDYSSRNWRNSGAQWTTVVCARWTNNASSEWQWNSTRKEWDAFTQSALYSFTRMPPHAVQLYS